VLISKPTWQLNKRLHGKNAKKLFAAGNFLRGALVNMTLKPIATNYNYSVIQRLKPDLG
jgi:hypothetical protein